MPATTAEARPARILIVDDAPSMRRHLNAILSAAGFESVEACDGAEAFHIVLDGGISLVITDLAMPVMDGFGLLSAIRLLPLSRCRPPVIVVSGLVDETAAMRRPELRAAAALLGKPVEPCDLLNTIAHVMGAPGSPG